MTSYFQEVAQRIQSKWLAVGYREAAFSSICTDVLLESQEAARFVNMDALLQWSLGPDRLPPQVDANATFGEPPLTVFSNDRFHITIYFWLDGTPDIHEHGFSGAFTVIKGTSLHTTFRFDLQETISDHLMLGKLTEQGVELVGRGDVREILPGAGTIHSLYHLERPSVSMVVRTHRNTFSRPQYIYSRSGAAWNPSYDRVELKRRLQLAKFVQCTEPDRLLDYCASWLNSIDPAAAFLGLRGILAFLPSEQGDQLLARAEKKHSVVVPLVRRVVENDRREMAITLPRSSVGDPELRFFLAVLLNVRGRESALRVIKKKFPGRDPIEIVMLWARVLSQLPATGNGTSALGFKWTDAVSTSLRSLLQGKSFDALLQDIVLLAGRPLTPIEERDLVRLREVLQSSVMFRYVLDA